jgi:hypothetical protein
MSEFHLELLRDPDRVTSLSLSSSTFCLKLLRKDPEKGKEAAAPSSIKEIQEIQLKASERSK